MSSIQDEIVTITHTTGGEAFSAGDPEAHEIRSFTASIR